MELRGVAQANIGLGHLSAAEAAIDSGLELSTRLGDERLACFLGCWQAQVATDQGHIDSATVTADHWLERADALGFKSGQGEALRVRAYVARQTGDHDRVLELASIAESHLEGTDEGVHPVWFSSIICESLIAVGRLDEAEQKIRATFESTNTAHMPHWEALLLRERGRLSHTRGNSDAARADLASSIQILDDLGSRIELGRSLALRAALKLGSPDDLERARTLFEACGAAGDLAKLEV